MGTEVIKSIYEPTKNELEKVIAGFQSVLNKHVKHKLFEVVKMHFVPDFFGFCRYEFMYNGHRFFSRYRIDETFTHFEKKIYAVHEENKNNEPKKFR